MPGEDGAWRSGTGPASQGQRVYVSVDENGRGSESAMSVEENRRKLVQGGASKPARVQSETFEPTCIDRLRDGSISQRKTRSRGEL